MCVREEWGCGWNDNTGEREMGRNRKVGVKKEKVEWKKERWYEQQRRERREKIEYSLVGNIKSDVNRRPQ